MLIIASISILVYGLIRVIQHAQWLMSERGEDPEPDKEPIEIGVRKKYHNGYTYISPTKLEDYENEHFEWDVHIKEGLGEDLNLNETQDYDED